MNGGISRVPATELPRLRGKLKVLVPRFICSVPEHEINDSNVHNMHIMYVFMARRARIVIPSVPSSPRRVSVAASNSGRGANWGGGAARACCAIVPVTPRWVAGGNQKRATAVQLPYRHEWERPRRMLLRPVTPSGRVSAPCGRRWCSSPAGGAVAVSACCSLSRCPAAVSACGRALPPPPSPCLSNPTAASGVTGPPPPPPIPASPATGGLRWPTRFGEAPLRCHCEWVERGQLPAATPSPPPSPPCADLRSPRRARRRACLGGVVTPRLLPPSPLVTRSTVPVGGAARLPIRPPAGRRAFFRCSRSSRDRIP